MKLGNNGEGTKARLSVYSNKIIQMIIECKQVISASPPTQLLLLCLFLESSRKGIIFVIKWIRFNFFFAGLLGSESNLLCHGNLFQLVFSFLSFMRVGEEFSDRVDLMGVNLLLYRRKIGLDNKVCKESYDLRMGMLASFCRGYLKRWYPQGR